MILSAESWTYIEEMFARAVDLPRDERKRLLDTTCDPTLRAEIDSLLDAHDTAPEFLAEPAAWLTAPEALPSHIGAYRVIRTLGRGGMGQVYLVEREAHDFRQIVALKVLRRGLDTDDLLARFRTERQILARLSHPNIARLFDVGATEQGLPYFVMEYVDGAPLLEHCAAHDVATRLRLFRIVCDAVQYAHRSLIVHRDIKPGNILVDRDGAVKLLDFGIARILDDDVTPRTRAEMRMLTPEYAAPEQIRGDAITTACDVHALGVLLYEMLAGVHPFRIAPSHDSTQQRARDAVIHAVLEKDPPPPSSHVPETSAMRRRLTGDLDTIVLKALRKDPDARYTSVQAMADDIDRHINGLPVQARPATLWYRTRKFVARNVVPVGAAASLFLLLTASSGITLYQSRRIHAESVRVGRERDKAMQTRSFLLEMFETTGPDQPTGDTVTARELLDRRATNVETAYRDDPEMRAEMQNVLAEGYDKLGIYDRAEMHARAALTTRRKLFNADNADVAISLNVLGWILHEAGKEAEADTLLRESVAMGRRVYPASGSEDLARSLNDLGVLREADSKYAEAAALYTESIDMRKRVSPDDQVGTAATTSNLSVVLYRQNDLNGAVKMGKSALALFNRALGADNQRTIIVQSNLAAMQSQLGDHAGAARQHRDLVAIRTRLFGARSASTAFSMSMLANELVMMDSTAVAAPLLDTALAIMHAANALPAQVESTLRVRGDLEHRTGRDALAVKDYADALAITRAALGPTHRDVPTLLTRSAAAYEKLGDITQAERCYRDAIAAATAAKAGKRTIGIQLSLVEMLVRAGHRDVAARDMDTVDRAIADNNVATTDSLRINARRARAALASMPREKTERFP